MTKKPTSRVVQARLGRFVRELRRSDALLLGGGGIIQDESSVINIIYYYLQTWVAQRVLRKPVFWAFVGVGPIKTKLGSHLLQRMGKLTKHVLVRDEESAALLRAHAFETDQITVAYDAVFNFPVPKKRPANRSGEQLLFCPRDWFFVATVTPTKYALKRARRNPHSRLLSYRTHLLRLVEACLRDNPGLTIVGVAFFYSQDMDLLLWIQSQLKPKYATRYKVESDELLPADFLSLAQTSSAILGVRLHSLILGAVAERPLSPLVYSAKVGNLVNYLKLGDFTTKLDKPDFAVDAAAGNVQAALHAKAPTGTQLKAIRSKNLVAFDELLNHVRASTN